MSSLSFRLKRLANKKRAGTTLIIGLIGITAGVTACPIRSVAISPTTPGAPPIGSVSTVTSSPVSLTATLSQSLMTQGANGTVALELSIGVPESGVKSGARQPADMIVVLDRSGSMAAEKRMTFAKSAILDLLSRLSAEDRFSLVTFDNQAETVTPLSYVTDAFRTSQRSTIERIEPRGSTNMSSGLELARSLIGEKNSSTSGSRIRKVLLLSDGEANLGITDASGLGSLVRTFNQSEAIVSTIGMGLGFNESIMASLADFGMGHYSYLENLASLGTILDKDLQDTRNVYASSSSIELTLPSGLSLVDAGGYPSENFGSGVNGVRVLTGQLLSSSKRSVIVTLKPDTTQLSKLSFSAIALNYTKDGRAERVAVDHTQLALQIIEGTKTKEAVASINQDLYRRQWSSNIVGMSEKKVAKMLREGDVDGAEREIAQLKGQAAAAQAYSGIAVADEVSASSSALAGSVDKVKNAAPAAKAEIQNRSAKDLLGKSRSSQMNY
jgi:Ca-activated chloride channel family protein